jgi:mitochondrial fission protein ELM1
VSGSAALRERSIWVLLGAHRGDNNQVLALAEALGLPFETKQLRYNFLYRLHAGLLPPTLWTLTPRSRALVSGDPPDLVIAINRRAVPVVRALRRRSGGRLRTVHLGNPRVPGRFFDLLITTPQYPVADAANVVRIPIAIGPPAARVGMKELIARLPERLGAPRRLFSIGGSTKNWSFDADDVAAAIAGLLERCAADGGSLMVVGSPRTPPEALAAAHLAVDQGGAAALLVPTQGPPSYAELLALADEIFITADSVSMISEAIATRKPVGLMPVRPTARGLADMARQDRRKPGVPNRPNDLRFFWAELERRGLVGTIERPRRGDVPDVLAASAQLIRDLLDKDSGAEI